MAMIAGPTLAASAAQRQRLREAIAKLATAIAEGGGVPTRLELEALIYLCNKHYLPTEAARVRRWMTP